ncbi:MAG: ankyrin repeat domain-containing protein [Spirochaetes bacterium]|nr:ankyrin repeat domain-containing protein [Spirochaetota bacterium]
MKIKYILLLFFSCFILFSNSIKKTDIFKDGSYITKLINEEELEPFKKEFEKYHVNSHTSNGKTLLMEAARVKAYDIAKYLIENNADINLQDKQGNSALVYAIERGRDEIALLLLENGADIKLKAKSKKIFVMACENGDTEVLKKLIDKGLKIKEYDDHGRNGLMVALYNNRRDDFVEYLCSLGINVNEKDDSGDTPLLMISRFAHAEDYMEILLKYGADPNIKDKKGKTALDYSAMKQSGDEIYVLQKHGAKLSTELP